MNKSGWTHSGQEVVEPNAALPVLIKRRAETEPDSVLIEDVSGGRITVAGFHEATIRVADALVALGITRGDCVVTMLDPAIGTQAVWLGVSWSGAMEVPVNPAFRGNSLINAINDCKARVLVTSSRHLEALDSVKSKLLFVETVVTVDEAVRWPSLGNIALAQVEADASSVEHREPQLGDPYAVIYTSGTTGRSKGVVIPWGSLQFALLNQLFKGDDRSLYEDPAFYSPWPSFHSSGRTGLAFAGHYNGRIVLRDKLSTSAFWDDVRTYNCTHVHLLGIAGWLMEQPVRPDDASNPLRRVLMNPVIEDFAAFERRFGVSVSTGWGMTEIGFPMAANNLSDFRTCGQLSTAYEARIVDESGQDLPDGEPGELIIRGKQPWLLFNEYLGNAEATRSSWRDGWYHTGDVLRRDSNGDYFFLDRLSDYMRVHGNNVSSMELEAEVRCHPEIVDVAAVAIPSDAMKAAGHYAVAGEDEICLFVRREGNATLGEGDLIAFLEPRLPRYMVPRFIAFVDDLPRTPTGKVQKKELRAGVRVEDLWDRKEAIGQER